MIQLSAVFSSHMVLQRQKNISVRGDSDAESLKITLADKSVSVWFRNREGSRLYYRHLRQVDHIH